MRLNSHTLASYMSLVAHALTTLSFLSEQVSPSQVSLVLMDSRLDSLSLPVVRASNHASDLDMGGQHDPSYPVALSIHQYFEWVGTFESKVKLSPLRSGSFTYSLSLYETTREDEKTEIVWRWGRVEGQPRVFNDRPGVVYIWQ
ncbi:hypothetical protein BGW80DRAFT_417349 [Lactifluus volemus]|nr:hypothetical protein BGW80DRAFT_417349 [Lactifluus volemus]